MFLDSMATVSVVRTPTLAAVPSDRRDMKGLESASRTSVLIVLRAPYPLPAVFSPAAAPTLVWKNQTSNWFFAAVTSSRKRKRSPTLASALRWGTRRRLGGLLALSRSLSRKLVKN